jgi:hypothetical protein
VLCRALFLPLFRWPVPMRQAGPLGRLINGCIKSAVVAYSMD